MKYLVALLLAGWAVAMLLTGCVIAAGTNSTATMSLDRELGLSVAVPASAASATSPGR